MTLDHMTLESEYARLRSVRIVNVIQLESCMT